VPAILAQMRRNPVRSRTLAGQRCGNRIRLAPSATSITCFAHRRHVIDIYT